MSQPAAEAPPARGERQIPGLSPALRRRARLLFRALTALSPTLAARVAAYVFVRPRRREITTEDARFLSTARSFRLPTARGDVQVYEWPAEGPTVLLAHGWISHAGRLRVIIEALQARGLRVVAFDAPAHGRSAGSHADLYRFREALTTVSAAMGPVQALIAHSFGALAAISWLADEARELPVRAVVLVGVPRDVGYLFDSFTIVLDLRADVVQRLRGLFRQRYGRDPESFSAALIAERIHAPVLLVHGSEDELVPVEHAGEIALQLPNGRVEIIEGASHGGPLRDEQTVQLMMRFLSERLLTGSNAQ